MSSCEDNDSLLISKALDCMGYSLDCIQIKRELFKKMYEKDENEYQVQLILAGSKAEGISNPLESDVDIMKCVNSFICCEDVRRIQKNKYYEIFYLDRQHASCGYTLMEYACKGLLGSVSKAGKVFERMVRLAACRNKRGRQNMSSDVFITEAQKTFNSNVSLWRSGPAVSFDLQKYVCPELNITMSFDYVFAIPLHSPNLLRQWKDRPRPYDWPPPHLQETIVNMNGHVVPVGYKLSDTQDKEWRICFTPAEKLLVWSFNETQLKLYVLMKIVAKCYLKSVCPDITSYVVKNLIFWLVEKLPPDVFRLTSLANLLMITLRVLKEAVDQKQLPNYMIMGRNLFAGRVEGVRRLNLLARLSQLLDLGPAFLYEIPEMGKLRSTLLVVYKNPTEVQRVESLRLCFLQVMQKAEISLEIPNGIQDAWLNYIGHFHCALQDCSHLTMNLTREKINELLNKFLEDPNCVNLTKTVLSQFLAKLIPGIQLHQLDFVEVLFRNNGCREMLVDLYVNVLYNAVGARNYGFFQDIIMHGFFTLIQ